MELEEAMDLRSGFHPNEDTSACNEQRGFYDDRGMYQSGKDKNIWLYNIHQDPKECNDLYDTYPEVVYKLLERLTYYNSTAVPCRYPSPEPNADPSKHGGLWGPWQ